MRPLLPALAALALGGPLPHAAPRFTSSIGGRCSTNKYAGTPPGAREAARIAWRERVNAAARWWRTCDGETESLGASVLLDAALSAPRPWRSSGKPTPRRRYSRAHRRGCWDCRNSYDSWTSLPLWNDTARSLWPLDGVKTFDEVRAYVERRAINPHRRRA